MPLRSLRVCSSSKQAFALATALELNNRHRLLPSPEIHHPRRIHMPSKKRKPSAAAVPDGAGDGAGGGGGEDGGADEDSSSLDEDEYKVEAVRLHRLPSASLLFSRLLCPSPLYFSHSDSTLSICLSSYSLLACRCFVSAASSAVTRCLLQVVGDRMLKGVSLHRSCSCPSALSELFYPLATSPIPFEMGWLGCAHLGGCSVRRVFF
jgi:hypothetical protein